MSNLLPEIIDAEPTEEQEDTEVFKMDEEMESEDLPHKIEVEEPLPEVKEKVKIDNELIFQKPVVKPVAKKKREMSEAKKKQLADARAKANAKRTANKEARLQAQAERDKIIEEKLKEKEQEYIEQKVNKQIKKSVKILDKEPVIYNNSLSLEDVENITSNAILKYDNQRKAQKEEKKKKKAEQEKHARINNTIKRAQTGGLVPTQAGYFDGCFG